MYKKNDIVYMQDKRGVVLDADENGVLAMMEGGALEIFNTDGSLMEDKVFYKGFWTYDVQPNIFFKVLKILNKENISTTLLVRVFSYSKGDMYIDKAIKIFKNSYQLWNPLKKVKELCPKGKETSEAKKSLTNSKDTNTKIQN